jgi:hypothetical protein
MIVNIRNCRLREVMDDQLMFTTRTETQHFQIYVPDKSPLQNINRVLRKR